MAQAGSRLGLFGKGFVRVLLLLLAAALVAESPPTSALLVTTAISARQY